MERDLWKMMVAATRTLPRTWPRNAVYSNRQILDVLMWAVLHDRPISWACRRENWPKQAWRRELPNQSTMSRRLRDPVVLDELSRVLEKIQHRLPHGRVLLTDGKALPVSEFTRDPDARTGRVSRGFSKGYRMHVVIDDRHRVLAHDVTPLNDLEQRVTTQLVTSMPQPKRARLLVADAGYDSNKLYAAAADRGLRHIAPRRKPGTGFGWRQHHPHRLASVRLTEQRGGWMWPRLQKLRWGVERFFAGLATSSVGLDRLPTWVRTLPRVRVWVAAKLVVNAARIARHA